MLFTSRTAPVFFTVILTSTLVACSLGDKPSDKAFDHYLASIGRAHVSSDERSRLKAAFEERQALLDHIEATATIDSDKIDADLARIKSDMLISQFFEKLYQKEITDTTISNYYQAHASDFTASEHHLSQLFLAYDSEAGQEGQLVVRTTAQEILARLHRGDSFQTLLEEYAGDKQSAMRSGDLGWVRESTLNQTLIKAAQTLKVEDSYQVVEAPYGIHIIKKVQDSREIARPLVQVKARIIKQLRSEIKARAMARALKKTAAMEILG